MAEFPRRLGPVCLTVADVNRQIRFYEDVIGLTVNHHDGDTVYLGTGSGDLLALVARPDAIRVPRTTGLYHFAILVPSRLALARSLRRLLELGVPGLGFADHFVSEAIYLSDPEGNGIEICRDLPRAGWKYVDGQLQMGTAALDIDGILSELNGQDSAWNGLHPDAVIGHVHLHVADTREAEAFYGALLGFDVMLRIPSASFLAMDGYHHHLGVNTWLGRGAPPPPPEAQGLRWATFRMPDAAALDDARSRLAAAGIPMESQPEGTLVHDSSGNGLLLTV
jgi:catechol 2,3-dioxygenase